MPDRFENHLSTWCHRAAHAFRMAFDAESRAWGLYGGEAVVLFKLKHYGSQSLAELSRRIGHSHPTVLAQVKNLEHAGYLSRSPHPEDRRVRIIELTASGVEIVSRFGRLADEMNERVVAQLGLQETARIIDDLGHLVEVLSTFTPSTKAHAESPEVAVTGNPRRKRPRLSR